MMTGWTKEYVGDSLTIDQIVFFFSQFRREENRRTRLETIGIANVVAAALGSDKDGALGKYIDSLDPDFDPNMELQDSLKKASQAGINIEEK